MRKLKIYRLFFTNSDCYKSGKKQVSKGVQVHSTGANNPYLKRYVQPDDGRLGVNPYGNSHNRPGVDVCANAYIGKLADGTVAVYQTLPWDTRCWISGKGEHGNANRIGYIGFEICEDDLTDLIYFEQAVMGAAVNLTAYLCLMMGLRPYWTVNGENGARAFAMAPNSSALLMDATAPIVWLCTTDGAGYLTASPFSITPYQPEKPVDVRTLEERIERLEAKLIEQSDAAPAKRRTARATNDADAE